MIINILTDTHKRSCLSNSQYSHFVSCAPVSHNVQNVLTIDFFMIPVLSLPHSMKHIYFESVHIPVSSALWWWECEGRAMIGVTTLLCVVINRTSIHTVEKGELHITLLNVLEVILWYGSKLTEYNTEPKQTWNYWLPAFSHRIFRFGHRY